MRTQKCYIGIDVGSISTDLVLVDEHGRLLDSFYLRTGGDPIAAVQRGLGDMETQFGNIRVEGVGVTGSGRKLIAALTGADLVKNEITAHAAGAVRCVPEVRTIIEIGGQDSKLILLRRGLVTDFAMNTVCAAGTGSFLDRQAERLGLRTEDLGGYALQSKNPISAAGRCAVFAESDMIHKQQIGCRLEDIIAGMCRAMVRNYMSNVAKGKRIEEPVCFQGGVAANAGMVHAFEQELGIRLCVPQQHKVMGAYGMALLAGQQKKREPSRQTSFRGFAAVFSQSYTETIACRNCENCCEVTALISGGQRLGCLGDRCGRFQQPEAEEMQSRSEKGYSAPLQTHKQESGGYNC